MQIRKVAASMFVFLGVAAVIAAAALILTERTRVSTQKFDLRDINTVSEAQWRKLAGQKIFFAHMSVGLNMIDGMKAVMARNDNIRLNIVETADPRHFTGPLFAHATLGHNTDPLAKLQSFRSQMESVGPVADIAFLKFCYVDINRDTDAAALFASYRKTITDLQAKYAGVRFIHLTVPLTSQPITLQSRVKGLIKTVIGRPGVADDNAKRDEYNTLLKAEYASTGNLFDLAAVESALLDGRTCFVRKAGKAIPVMAPAWTTDGGHLNPQGQHHVAQQLLTTLATLP
jgi:hypothetical protein